MTTLNLPHLKEAALAATPGPWKRTAGYGVSIQIPNDKQHQDFATYNGDAKLLLVAESKHGRLPGRDADFIAAANPAAVLELIARLEQAQAMLEISHSSNVLGALKIVMSMRDGDFTYFAGRQVLPETLRSFASGAIDLVSMEASRTYQQLQGDIAEAAMPNDPLDDVLPLAKDQFYSAPLGQAWSAPSAGTEELQGYGSTGTVLEGTEGSSHG